LWVVPGFPRGQPDRHRALGGVGQGVDLRCQSAPGPADCVVSRLVGGFPVIRQRPL
jgi:hypothetical protein